MAVTYEQLAPVLFGTDALADMADRAKDQGLKRAFLCCDPGVKASGIADRVAGALEAKGVAVWVYDRIRPDAPDTFVEDVARRCADWGTDLMIGVGGGSSLDTAKAAGVVLDNGKPLATFMEENGNPGFVIKTPAWVIPTSAGTGSECTPMCVIHETASHTKKVVLRPAQLAILDPTLTVTCPPSVTANSGMDALSHAIEAYTSVNHNPKDMLLAIHAIKLIAENLPKCIQTPDDLEARGNMLFASNLAGIAFAAMSVHVGHCFSHEVGLKFHMNHGLACGLATPETITFVAEQKPQEILDIAQAMGIPVPAGATPREAARRVADGIRALMHQCGMKSLRELGIDRTELVSIAQDAVDHNWFHVMCPGDVSYRQMADYIGRAYDNYQ